MAIFPSFIFDTSKGETPQSIAMKRALAAQIMGGFGNRPARNVGEGIGNALASLGQGITANVMNRRAMEGEEAGQASAREVMNPIMQAFQSRLNGGFPAAPAEGGGHSGDPMTAYQNAIASIESAGSGDYAAVGPSHPKLGRALGRYQVMEANVGPWTEKHLGRRLTPEQFLASPEAQDAVFNGEFGSYVNKYGPEGAAQAWFGGEGGVGKLNRRDSLGTSIGAYTDKFRNALGAPATNAVNALGGARPVGVAETEADILAQEQAMAAQSPAAFAVQGAIPQQPMQVAQAGGLPEMAGHNPQALPAPGVDMNMLAQAMSNPFLMQNEGMRALVMGEYERLMQSQDPMRQLDMDYRRAQIGKMEREAAGGNRRYGLNPIYGTDPQTGQTVLGVLGDDGSFKPVDTGGVDISTGVDRVDLGTQWGLLDKRSGQMVGTLPKENYQEAFDTAAGSSDAKAAADARADLPKVEDNAISILSMIDSLDSDPYLDRMVGPVSGRLPNISGDAARVQSKMDQIGGQAFLQAFETLRGGGQISNVEGQKATEALARLNTAQSPADYRQALTVLRGIVRQSLERARRLAGAGSGGTPPPGASGDGWQDMGGVRIRRKQ